MTSAISGVGTITGMSTVGRSKSRMTGEQRKRHAQKQRKKLMKEMDQNIERQDSLSRAGSRPGSRGPTSRMANEVDLNAKAAGAEFSMDLLSKKLSGLFKHFRAFCIGHFCSIEDHKYLNKIKKLYLKLTKLSVLLVELVHQQVHVFLKPVVNW